MTQRFSQTNPTDDEPKNNTSPDSQAQESPSKEMALLASGILILVLGIGGALMYSDEEAFRVESSKAVPTDQLSQAFPKPAMAFESPSTSLPPNPTGLPVSTTQDVSQPQGKSMVSEIEENEVHFGFDQALLSAEAKGMLETQAQQFDADKNGTILVRGHTDQKGSQAYNEALSLRRAEAVKAYLVSLGLSEDWIHVKGLGEAEPLCFEPTDACGAKNRRANVIITKLNPLGVNSQPIMSQSTSDSEQDPLTSPEGPHEVSQSGPDSIIETVQLSESAEEITPNDPIVSVTEPQ